MQTTLAALTLRTNRFTAHGARAPPHSVTALYVVAGVFGRDGPWGVWCGGSRVGEPVGLRPSVRFLCSLASPQF